MQRELRRKDMRQAGRPLRVGWEGERCLYIEVLLPSDGIQVRDSGLLLEGTSEREDDTTLDTSKLR